MMPRNEDTGIDEITRAMAHRIVTNAIGDSNAGNECLTRAQKKRTALKANSRVHAYHSNLQQQSEDYASAAPDLWDTTDDDEPTLIWARSNVTQTSSRPDDTKKPTVAARPPQTATRKQSEANTAPRPQLQAWLIQVRAQKETVPPDEQSWPSPVIRATGVPGPTQVIGPTALTQPTQVALPQETTRPIAQMSNTWPYAPAIQVPQELLLDAKKKEVW